MAKLMLSFSKSSSLFKKLLRFADWPRPCFFPCGMVRDERKQQVIVGFCVVAGVAGLILLIAWARYLPGVGGEFFGRILGIISTPFLMEASFCVLGLVLVMALNIWRQRRDGDELVYLEEVKDAPADLPDQAKWAVYQNAPLEAASPGAAVLLEGALAIGDHASAVEILESMDDSQRRQPETLRLRIALAKATGKEELARRLEAELAASAG